MNVDTLTSLCNFLTDMYTLPGLLLCAAILALVVVQAWYWMGTYARIHRFRNEQREVAATDHPAISVVVVIRDETYYITEVLPRILEQQYADFEVVAVDMCHEQENSEELALVRQRYPRLHITRLVQQERRAKISNKMALNVGIKAASCPNILLTTTEARPASPKWLPLMAKGFANGQVVIGYCGLEAAPGAGNSLARAARLEESVRYLSSAIRGRTYRGIRHNIGYTADLYFRARGFDHLNMTAGEDDLFIQRIAGNHNTSIVMNPNASMIQLNWERVSDRFRRRMEERAAWPYYPQWARNYISWEKGSRVLLLVSCVAAMVFMPLEIALAAAGVLALRLGAATFQMWRIARRLGERKILAPWLLWDLISPFYECAVWAAGLRRRR